MLIILVSLYQPSKIVVVDLIFNPVPLISLAQFSMVNMEVPVLSKEHIIVKLVFLTQVEQEVQAQVVVLAKRITHLPLLSQAMDYFLDLLVLLLLSWELYEVVYYLNRDDEKRGSNHEYIELIFSKLMCRQKSVLFSSYGVLMKKAFV
jgi:hypothetical protein